MRNNGLIPSTILLLFIYLALLGVIYKLLENLIDSYLKNKIYLFLVICSILLIPLALAALVATRYVAPSGLRLRKFQVGMHRWIGKIYRWLGTGWRSSSVILADVVIVFAVVKGVLYLMTDQLQEKVFFGSTIYNASVNGTTSAGTNFSWTINNATVNGSLPYLNLNETAFQGFLLEVGAKDGIGFLNGSLALILGTILQDWEKIGALWFLILIVKIASDASQRLVVEEVTDYTQNSHQDEKTSKSKEDGGEQKSKKLVGGLSDLLIVHINRINELYMAVDDKRAIHSECGAGKPIDANIKTEDLSDFLSSEAVGGSSEVSFFGIKIPAGTITGLFGRMIRGPRIVISQHKIDDGEEKGRVVLMATMTKNKNSYSWRVDSLEPLDDGQAGKIGTKDDMVKELATRIVHRSFSEETSARWKAWYHFNEGLRSYRDGLVSTKKRRYNLKLAEKSFIRALEETNDFALAYYNLGVVYTELHQEEAAEVAFSKAIENNPELNAAYYALGFNQFCKAEAKIEDLTMIFVEPLKLDDSSRVSCNKLFWKQCQIFKSANDTGYKLQYIPYVNNIIKIYENVIILCDQTIHIAKNESNFMNRDFTTLAKAYNLKANALSRIDMLRSDDSLKAQGADYLESAELAVEYSWKALFKAEFESEMITKIKTIKTLRECSIDFADLCLYYYSSKQYPEIKYVKDAEDALKQAQFIDPTDANTYIILGKRYYCTDEFSPSTKFYKNAVQVEPGNSDFWAYLALAYAYDENKTKEALSACERVRIYESGASFESMETAALAYERLIKYYPEYELQKSRLTRASMIAKMDWYLDVDGPDYAGRISHKINCIDAKLEYWELDDKWTYAQYAIALACLCYRMDKKERPICDDKLKKILKNEAIDKLEEVLMEANTGTGRKVTTIDKEHYTFTLGYLYYLLPRSNSDINQKFEEYFAKVIEYIRENKDTQYTIDNSFLLIKMGGIYRNSGNFREAESCFKQAIKMLEIDYPEVVKRERLHLLLAEARIKQHNKFEALKEARKFQTFNPISQKGGEVTGDIYCDLEKYKIALEEFYDALVWEPDNPSILIKIGKCYIKRAVLCRDASDRTKALNKANEHFERAWKLYDKDKLKERTETRYLIAKTYMELCDYEGAAPHLIVIYNAMSSREKQITPKVLIVAIQLGLTYFKMRSLTKNEKMFKDVLEKGRSYMKKRVYLAGEMPLSEMMARTHFGLASSTGLDRALKVVRDMLLEFNELKESSIDEMSFTEIVALAHIEVASSLAESNPVAGLSRALKVVRDILLEFNELREYSIDKMSLAGIMAHAHIGLAYSFAERNTEVCLDRALKEVQEAKRYINLLKSGDEMTKCLEMNSDCEGWVRYKQHQICDKKMAKMIKLECKELIELSIKSLELSVSIRANLRAYLHLALAYKAKSEIKTEPERNNLLQRAKVCCKLARDLDIKGEYNEELKDLEKDLGIFKNDNAESPKCEPDR